ncbi:MAG: hypothetical protein ACREU6_09835 [Steroidobacteraceae bacterium]
MIRPGLKGSARFLRRGPPMDDVVGNGLAISTSTDPAELLAQRQALEAGTARFKQRSTVLVPLGEQALTVENAASTLDDWRAASKRGWVASRATSRCASGS